MQIKIPIPKEYIAFRSEAKNIQLRIKKELKRNHLSSVALDFSAVVFVSRSFADELLNVIEEFGKNGKKSLFLILNLKSKNLFPLLNGQKKRLETKFCERFLNAGINK